MRQETITLYKFNELPTDSAKEKARDWYRQGGLDHEWCDAVYEDCRGIFAVLGIDAEKEAYRLLGKPITKPAIYFSGFSSQGDGACFEGRYAYAKGSVKAMQGYAPRDKELQRIAADLQSLQRKHFYKIEATMTHRGRYAHEYCVDFVVTVDGRDASEELESSIKDLMRDLMRWIYRTLEAEWDYLTSDECVDENILCNEYEFTETGERHV